MSLRLSYKEPCDLPAQCRVSGLGRKNEEVRASGWLHGFIYPKAMRAWRCAAKGKLRGLSMEGGWGRGSGAGCVRKLVRLSVCSVVGCPHGGQTPALRGSTSSLFCLVIL